MRIPNKTKRTQRAKARRLAASEAQKKLAKEPASRECHVTATRAGEMVTFQARLGYFSPRVGPVFAIHELEVVEALDNPNALIETVMKAGIAVLSGITRTPVMGKKGTDALKDLADGLAKWMKLDVEALKAELAKEKAEEVEAALVDGTPQVMEAVEKIEAELPPAEDPALNKFRQTADEVPA